MPFFENNSHRLFYREAGSGQLLMILPGNTASSACHENEMKYFEQYYHTVSLDFWGTGKSDRIDLWPDDWREQCAHDAIALLRYLDYSDGFIMGTSGGAITALLMAIMYPKYIQGVIADSTVEYFPPPALSNSVKDRFQYTKDQVGFWQWAHGIDWEQVVKADSDYLLRFEKSGGDCFKGKLQDIICPVLLSASLNDQLLPDIKYQIHKMAKQITGSHVYLSSEGHHPLMWSCADDFRREAVKFLNKLNASKA